MFLGGKNTANNTMRPPGAFHHARWMAKSIYAIKIFLFRSQFKLTANELKAMKQISLFVSLVYATAWNEATLPSYAPFNDIQFLRHLKEGVPEKSISDVALKAFKRHL